MNAHVVWVGAVSPFSPSSFLSSSSSSSLNLAHPPVSDYSA